MRRFSCFFGVLAIAACFWLAPSAEASGILESGWENAFEKEGALVKPGEGDSITLVRNIFFERILPQFKYLFAFVSILVWTVYVLLMITSAGSEEQVSKNRQNLLWGAFGFLTISLAVMIGEVFAPTRPDADVIDIVGAQLFAQKIVGFIQLFLTPIAVAMIAYAGIKLIIGGGDDKEPGNAKKILAWGLTGLVIAMVAEPLVNTVFYPGPENAPGTAEQGNFAAILMDVLRFFLSFLAVLVLVSFVLAGAYYLTSFGDESRHKRATSIMLASVLGVVIILMAFVIISAFVPGDEIV